MHFRSYTKNLDTMRTLLLQKYRKETQNTQSHVICIIGK